MNHKILSEFCLESYDHYTFSVGDCEVLVKYEEDYQIVAIRGTEITSFRDLFRDISIIPTKDKDLGWCHSGFLSGGIKVAKFLDKILLNKPIYITGHSMGGAVGLITSAILSNKGYDIVEWVGFASPKCQFLKNRFKGFNQINYRYRADLIPLVPLLLYKHNYPVIALNKEKGRLPTIEDHSLQLYVDWLGDKE